MKAVVAGMLVAAFSSGAFAQASGADSFEDRCSMCHILGATGQGPNLKGVVGRKAASGADFNYTPELKASGLTWTPETLDKFLTNPSALVPGTAMLARVNDGGERAALIRYLATQR